MLILGDTERGWPSILKGNGLLLSEFPAQSTAKKWTYVQRNRVIAGLCETLGVVEAPLRSGALISAQFAVDCGRGVCSSSPSLSKWTRLSAIAKGCASFCLGTEWGVSEPTIDGRPTEEIAHQWGETIAFTHKQLTELALVGRIYSQAGKWYIHRRY